jgi:hypothetical protein
MDKSNIDKDLLELHNIAMKSMLKNTKYKLFFTQSEFNEKYGEIMIINHIHDKLQNKYNDEKYLENQIIKIQERKIKK